MVEGESLPGMQGSKWAPQRSNDYEQDCAIGRTHAEALMQMMAEQQNPALFGTVVRAITLSGTYDAVEIGFCSGIGIALIGLGR